VSMLLLQAFGQACRAHQQRRLPRDNTVPTK